MIKVMGQLSDQLRERVPLRSSGLSLDRNFIMFCLMVCFFQPMTFHVFRGSFLMEMRDGSDMKQ
jgi:hypothetical protein